MIPVTDLVYVPLGTRCDTAGVLKENFKKRIASYPFDWIDIQLPIILEFVQIPDFADNLSKWINEYMRAVNPKNCRHPDGTWLPHDFKPGGVPDYNLQEIIDRYIRRFTRLFDLFISGKNIIFLTVMPFTRQGDTNVFEQIKKTIKKRVLGSCLFVTINLTADDFVTEDHFNFHIPLKDDWDLFKDAIAGRLESYPGTAPYFKSTGIW